MGIPLEYVIVRNIVERICEYLISKFNSGPVYKSSYSDYTAFDVLFSFNEYPLSYYL